MKEGSGIVTELARRNENATEQSRFQITVVGVANDGTNKTCVIVDGSKRILVGQSPVCDLLLTDRMVSRRHLALEATPDGLRCTDLESTNGTWVEKLRVHTAYLQGGETISIGDVRLHCERLGNERLTSRTVRRFGRNIGVSPQVTRVFEQAEKVAATDLPIIIEGETGTGKEVLAEAIHEFSGRKGGPFVVFDCTTVPDTLLESALFGHERGAFTGATEANPGVFEKAHGGTLFIDEIGDLALPLQSRLLRAVQSGEIQKVGGRSWTKFDVRIICATRRDLDREVQEGRFRDDLFYRLAVARLELPPLRARDGDVALLTRHFFREMADLEAPDPIVRRFERHNWPGNIRELHLAVAHEVHVGGGERSEWDRESPSQAVLVGDFIGKIVAKDLPMPIAREEVLDEFYRRYVERVLERYNGNVTRAVAASGIKRRYFQVLRARHGRGEQEK